jgi:Domain of unknown function (DUF4153)
MEERQPESNAQGTLPIILLAAVVQGGSLYLLHRAIAAHHWPATDSGWLIALYGVVLFAPLTVQSCADHARTTTLWILVGIVAVAYFYFGWHEGRAILGNGTGDSDRAEDLFPLGVVAAVLWLHALPFAQARLTEGRWRVPYRTLFGLAWRNVLMLAEAALFTALLWLLLALWQTLFYMLGVSFFRELFSEPLFVYPVTSLTFGIALHLIGSVERLTTIVLEQLLNVLKWLAVVAGIILVLFTTALIFKLPGLMFTGKKAIGAAWLLWLVAVIVLLLNAAFRDGSNPRPYPVPIAQALRFTTPLTVVCALTAVYALWIRTQNYGLTVERVWAFVVAGEAMIYSVGYTIAAFGRGPWLAGIVRVNVVVAVAFIVTASLSLTPVLSPYRLAANSQFAMSQHWTPDANKRGYGNDSPFEYLRFDSGQYGRDRLALLRQWQIGPDAALIRQSAEAALKQENRWQPPEPMVDADALLAALPVFPSERSLDPYLRNLLVSDVKETCNRALLEQLSKKEAAGIYVDLDGDGHDEFVLVATDDGRLYQQNAVGHWLFSDHIRSPITANRWPSTLRALSEDHIAAVQPHWKDLVIGGRTFRVDMPR